MRSYARLVTLILALLVLSFIAGLLLAIVTDAGDDWTISVYPPGESPYSCIVMTEQEEHELETILALEAQGEGLLGEIAVCEVIFNRVLSPNWPDSIHGVLSQRGQFPTWKYLSKPYNIPGEMESDAITEVLTSPATVLPDRRYVYFDTKGRNGKEKIRIGNHVFGREK